MDRERTMEEILREIRETYAREEEARNREREPVARAHLDLKRGPRLPDIGRTEAGMCCGIADTAPAAAEIRSSNRAGHGNSGRRGRETRGHHT